MSTRKSPEYMAVYILERTKFEGFLGKNDYVRTDDSGNHLYSPVKKFIYSYSNDSLDLIEKEAVKFLKSYSCKKFSIKKIWICKGVAQQYDIEDQFVPSNPGSSEISGIDHLCVDDSIRKKNDCIDFSNKETLAGMNESHRKVYMMGQARNPMDTSP